MIMMMVSFVIDRGSDKEWQQFRMSVDFIAYSNVIGVVKFSNAASDISKIFGPRLAF